LSQRPYRKFPPDPPRMRRGMWILVLVLAAVLLANLIDQSILKF
jgi:hypothetical protein